MIADAVDGKGTPMMRHYHSQAQRVFLVQETREGEKRTRVTYGALTTAWRLYITQPSRTPAADASTPGPRDASPAARAYDSTAGDGDHDAS